MLLERMHKQALGKIQMSQESLRACEFLLSRVVPRAEMARESTFSASVNVAQMILQAAGMLPTIATSTTSTNVDKPLLIEHDTETLQ
jgi:hypothetical protein